MGKIKIVFVHWTLNIGGTEKQFIEIVQRLDRNRFEPRVLVLRSCGKLREEIEALRIPLTYLGFSAPKGRFHFKSYVKLYKLIRDMVRYFKQEKPQIVQSYLRWVNILSSLTAKIARAPVIITGRRAIMDERYMTFPKFPDQWLQNLSNVWTTTVIANSYNVRRQCLQQEKFLTEEKIRVIYNGVNLDRYKNKRNGAKIRKTLQLPENALVIGVIATLRPRKGYQDFLNAAAHVLQKYPQTVFLLVGRDGGSRDALENLAQELHISHSIFFTGERDDIPEVLSSLDVQVCCSFYEGLSNAILEGMAAGNPMIATNIAGNPELVVHEQTGLLVPPGEPQCLAEAIIRLLGDKTLRIQMGALGRQRVEKLFRMDQMIHATVSLYQNLVNTNT